MQTQNNFKKKMKKSNHSDFEKNISLGKGAHGKQTKQKLHVIFQCKLMTYLILIPLKISFSQYFFSFFPLFGFFYVRALNLCSLNNLHFFSFFLIVHIQRYVLLQLFVFYFFVCVCANKLQTKYEKIKFLQLFPLAYGKSVLKLDNNR